MSVLNRAMFNQSIVRRKEGSPQQGETGFNFFESFSNLLKRNNEDDSTVYDFGEYGGKYDLKEEGFQRVLRNYLPEGAVLFDEPNELILSEDGMRAIELFAQDIQKMQDSKRAMGSPITGEGINGLKKLDEMQFRQEGSPMQGEMAQQAQMMPQQNPENVGIMQGFEEDAETIVRAGSEKKQKIDESADYTELMNSIRGDDKTEDQRRDELAEIVGEKDANDTPESVLTLVQPVIQMLDSPKVREQGIGATPQAFAMGGPVYRDDGTPKTGENANNQVGLDVLMAILNQGKVNVPTLAESYTQNLPLFSSVLGRDRDRTLADTFFNISQGGFGLAAGMTPQEALMMTLQGQQKIGDKVEARDLAIKQAALGQAGKERSAAQAMDLAVRKELAKKKDTKGTTFVVGSGVEIPTAVSSLLSKDQINNYPDGTNIFVDEKNKLTINIPTQADQEAYYDTENQRIVFLTDKEYNDLEDKSNITTVSAGLSFTKLAKIEDGKVVEGTIKDIRNTQQDEIDRLIKEGFTIISNTFEVNKDREGGALFQAKGGIVERSSGSPESGETTEGSDYEAILADAEKALGQAGVVFPSITDADKSFFNSLYASTLESLNDLKRVKELMAADPSLTGYTGLAQETLTNFATLINDMDNYMGDNVFPDDSKGQPKYLKYFTKPEIRELKFKVAELSDAVADILSLRGKRGTTADVRGQALKRTDLTGFYGSDVAFEKIDSLTDYLTDRVKVFGMLSGNFEPGEAYDEFNKNITALNNAIKNINPNTYEGKKSTYSLEELESILGK